MTNFGNNDPLNNDRNRANTTSSEETTTLGRDTLRGNSNRNRANTAPSSISPTMTALAIAAAVVIGGYLLLSNDWGQNNSQVLQTGEQGTEVTSNGNAPAPVTPAPVTPAPTAPATN